MQTDERPGGSIEMRLLDARAQFLGFIRKRVEDPDLAEDILQDSLPRAIRAAPELRDEERLIPWFYRVLRNAIIDAYRRHSAEQKHVVVADIPDVAAEPERDAELCACFERLIPMLKTDYADLIQAVELGDESPDHTAGRLGNTLKNLKVRRHRARQALRRKLEETCRTCADHGCLDCTCRPG